MKYLLMIIILGTCSISLHSQQEKLYSVTHHIVRMDDGSGGQDTAMIPVIMDEINKAFAPAGIQFYIACKKNINIKFFTK